MKLQHTRENSEVIEQITDAFNFLSDLHGEDYSDALTCSEDLAGLAEDIHRARLALTEDEYSEEDHAKALGALSTLQKHAYLIF